MTDKPLAAYMRENEFLRDVASKAIKLRSIGRSLDAIRTAYIKMTRNAA